MTEGFWYRRSAVVDGFLQLRLRDPNLLRGFLYQRLERFGRHKR